MVGEEGAATKDRGLPGEDEPEEGQQNIMKWQHSWAGRLETQE